MVATGREEALTEEFPGYLREAIFRWLKGEVNVSGGYADTDRFVDFQNASRIDLGFRAEGFLNWEDSVLPYLRQIGDDNFTKLIDFFASTAFFPQGHQHPLESMLSDGGSAWTIIRWNGSHARLTKRVSDGVHLAVREALSATDAASAKLQEAWLDAYGTTPGPPWLTAMRWSRSRQQLSP